MIIRSAVRYGFFRLVEGNNTNSHIIFIVGVIPFLFTAGYINIICNVVYRNVGNSINHQSNVSAVFQPRNAPNTSFTVISTVRTITVIEYKLFRKQFRQVNV